MKKSKFKNEKGAVSTLVLFTVLMFSVILTGVYMIITTRQKAQLKSDLRIQQIYKEDVDRVDEVYSEIKEKNFNSYTEVEYIESTGSQYIDIGYKQTPNTGIEADFQFTDLALQQRLYGCSTDDNIEDILCYDFYINGDGQWAYAYKDKTGNWISTRVMADTNRHKLSFNVKDKKIQIDDGNTVNLAITETPTITSKNGIAIIARNYQNRIDCYAKLKLYSFNVYENGSIVKELVPCVRKFDDKPGLYDKINKIFYTNQGTGEDFKVNK